MKESERENMGAFISHHNIIRPVELTTHGFWFFPAGSSVLFIFPLFMTPVIIGETNYAESIGRVLCAVLLIIGIVLRIYLVKMYQSSPGKSLYLTEMFKYLYFYVICMMLWFYATELIYGIHSSLIQLCVILGINILTIAGSYLIIKDQINKGRFLQDGGKLAKKIAYSTTGAGLIGYILAGSVIKSFGSMYTVLVGALVLTIICLILAFQYFLKLRYAKKYGLEEFMPDRPLPSQYTGEK